MAITKILARNAGLSQAIQYALNGDNLPLGFKRIATVAVILDRQPDIEPCPPNFHGGFLRKQRGFCVFSTFPRHLDYLLTRRQHFQSVFVFILKPEIDF